MAILRESTSGGLIELGRSTEFHHSSAWSLAGNISLFWKNHAMRAASLRSTISRQLLPSILDFIFLHNIPKIKPKCIKHVMVACSATTVTVGPLRQSWPIRLQQNNNTLTPRKLVVGQSAACKSKQAFFRKAKCFTRQCFSIQNFAYNTQEIYFFDTSCYFVIYQQFLRSYCRTLQQLGTTNKKDNYCLRFSHQSLTLTDLSGNMCFLQWVQKITSVGCNWLISIHVVDFVLW